MFSGERSAVRNDQVGCFLHEAAKFLNAVGGFEIESDARVQTTVAEVAVLRATILVSISEFAKLAHVSTEFVRRDGGILPAFPCQWLPGYARNRAQRRLTDLPNFSCLQLVCKQT